MSVIAEDDPLPLARMATINKPSFWIFMGACLLLYICSKLLTPDTVVDPVLGSNDLFIIGAAFAGLFLNLITSYTNDQPQKRILTLCCYIFEAGSVIVLAYMVFAA